MMLFNCCSRAEQAQEEFQGFCNLKVKVSGIVLSDDDFSTRAAAETVSTVNRILIAVFDSEGTKIKEVLQKKGEEGYGTQTFRLPAGSYSIEAVSYKGDESSDDVSFTSQTEVNLPLSRATDAFNGYKNVLIEKQNNDEISIDMNRCVSSFTIVSNNKIPDNVYKVEFIMSKGNVNTFNPMTGFALSDVASSQSILVSNTKRSLANPFFTVYVFLTSAEQDMEITVNARNSDNEILYSHVIEGKLKRARQLTATGTFFEGSITSGFNFIDEWLTGDNVEF